MEDIDGGLHPAVDGQSLDEDEDEVQSVQTQVSQKAEMHTDMLQFLWFAVSCVSKMAEPWQYFFKQWNIIRLQVNCRTAPDCVPVWTNAIACVVG